MFNKINCVHSGSAVPPIKNFGFVHICLKYLQ